MEVRRQIGLAPGDSVISYIVLDDVSVLDILFSFGLDLILREVRMY